MKEKQILFKADMVNAILSGNKTVTRRLINPQPKLGENIFKSDWHPFDFVSSTEQKGIYKKHTCPYDAPELWVRETIYEDMVGSESLVRYADGQKLNKNWHTTRSYCPSIFMPRWASRIQLKVLNIKVERVQDITYRDAVQEGIEREWDGTAFWYKNYSGGLPSMFKEDPVRSFETLWNSINKKRGYGWDKNPWVWPVEFEVIK